MREWLADLEGPASPQGQLRRQTTLKNWYFVLVGALLALGSSLSAQTPRLVKDINTAPDPSAGIPLFGVVSAGGKIFFSSDRVSSDPFRQVWVSDGTPAGTRVIATLAMGQRQFVASGGTVFFSNRSDLWKTDGTEAGTQRVLGASDPPLPGNLADLTDVNGTLYFTTDRYSTPPSLWKSDGTAAGTVLVKAVEAMALVVSRGRLFFVVNDPDSGYELWKSDGTEAGTVRVADVCPGSCSGVQPSTLVDVGGTLFFTADDGVAGDELWKSDGTEAGTVRVRDIEPGAGSSSPSELVSAAGTLFFRANRGFSRGLWKSDGSEAGTVLVSDVDPQVLTPAGSLVYFAVDDSLWRSDGTAGGTVLCKSSVIGWGGAAFAAIGEELYFRGSSPTGTALWRSDGTVPGTQLVVDVDPFSSMAVLGGTLFFGGYDLANGSELWRSDGTAVGTTLVTNRIDTSSDPSHLRAAGGRLFFVAREPTSGAELWTSDGTEAGTHLVRDILPGPASAFDFSPTVWGPYDSNLLFASAESGRRIFFAALSTATPAINHGELWTSDGTAVGTRAVIPAGVGLAQPPVRSLVLAGGRSLFWGTLEDDSDGLWSSDGTPAGTSLVKDMVPGVLGAFPSEFTRVGEQVFFKGYGDLGGQRYGPGLWKTDGTKAGTTLVSSSSKPALEPVYLNGLTNLGGRLFFVANDVGRAELWTSDGTAGGTVLVKDLWPKPYNGDTYHARGLARAGGFSFVELTTVRGIELWRSDGTPGGTGRVKVFENSPSAWQVTSSVGIGNRFAFLLSDEAGSHLWASDGTEAGTVLLKSFLLDPARLSFVPGDPPVVVGGRAYFVADDGHSGRELWRTDGTEAGTELVYDLAPGPASSSPHELTAVGPDLYFAADDGISGTELWVLGAIPDVTVRDAADVSEDVCRPVRAVFRVALSVPSLETVTVDYTTVDGTAIAGSDYAPRAGTLTFPPGVTTLSVQVPVVSDRVLERTESFALELSAPTWAVIDRPRAKATLRDHKQPTACTRH
jgi:ELWxxDGT repeat protein